MLDYYKILEVSQNATKDEIKKKFRKLANIYHPDKNQNSQKATEYFKVVLNAYEVLHNEVKRKDYDIRYNNFYKPKISNDNETVNQPENKTKDLKKSHSNKNIIVFLLIILAIFYYINSIKDNKIKEETQNKLDNREAEAIDSNDLDTIYNTKQERPNSGEIKF